MKARILSIHSSLADRHARVKLREARCSRQFRYFTLNRTILLKLCGIATPHSG
jgi:hypothetical protein